MVADVFNIFVSRSLLSLCWNMCAFTQSWWLEPRTMSWTPPGQCACHNKAQFLFSVVSVSCALCGRWKKYEIHDIVIECAKVSLDPKEASCEEGYTTMPETFYPQVHLRPQECTSSPFCDLQSSFGERRDHTCSFELLWLPSAGGLSFFLCQNTCKSQTRKFFF